MGDKGSVAFRLSWTVRRERWHLCLYRRRLRWHHCSRRPAALRPSSKHLHAAGAFGRHPLPVPSRNRSMRRGFAHTYGNGDCNSYSYGHSYSNRDRDANGYQRAEVDTDAEAASDTTASSLVRNAIWNLLRWELARKAREPPDGKAEKLAPTDQL